MEESGENPNAPIGDGENLVDHLKCLVEEAKEKFPDFNPYSFIGKMDNIYSTSHSNEILVKTLEGLLAAPGKVENPSGYSKAILMRLKGNGKGEPPPKEPVVDGTTEDANDGITEPYGEGTVDPDTIKDFTKGLENDASDPE